MSQDTLFEPGTTTGHDHPRTSHAAAARALPRTGTQRAAVLRYISERPFGATDDEIAAGLGIPGNSVRPRRVELAEAGWIERSGKTRRNAYGNECDVWVAS